MYRLIFFKLSESYFKHRWLYLLPIIILMGCGIAYLFLAEPKYMAQGVMYIQKTTFLSQLTSIRDNNLSVYYTPAQMTANEMSNLFQTDAFIRAVIKETPLESEMNKGPKVIDDTLQKVRENLWVNPMGDNQIMVGATYKDPQVSIALVQGALDSYVRWKSNGQRTDSQVALGFFTDLINSYRSDLDKARAAMTKYLEAHPDPLRGDRPPVEKMEISSLQSDIDLAQTRYSNALDKEENARLSIAQVATDTQQTYMVIDAPHMPMKQATSTKDKAVKFGIFTAVGILLALAAISGNALADRTFRVPLDAQTRLNLPVLANIPDANRIEEDQKRKKSGAKSVKLNRKERETKDVSTQPAALIVENQEPNP